MKPEKLKSVDFLQYNEDTLRISHATPLLTPASTVIANEKDSKKYRKKVRQEIENRKKIMAQLNKDCQRLQSLIE